MRYGYLNDRIAQLRMTAITQGLLRLNELTVVIDPRVHDNERHFAACSERADEIRVAPQLADLPSPIVDGILMHELGHAADFAYPARWRDVHLMSDACIGLRSSCAALHEDASRADVRRWKRRDPYQVEFDADRIAEAIFDVRIGYVGPLMLQSTEGGVRPRPFGI